MKRRLKITITKVHREKLIAAPEIFRFVCPVCAKFVETHTRAESIRILKIDSSKLETLIVEGALHTAESADGKLRLCKNSLLNQRAKSAGR